MAKITQPYSWGAYSGKRYGSLFTLTGDTATTELLLDSFAVMSIGAYLVATTELELTSAARFSARGTVQNVTPKS